MLIDDGLATGSTMKAAVKAVRAAVGQWYRDFAQTSDEEVGELLREHADAAARTR